MTETRRVEVVVYESDQQCSPQPPENLNEFIVWITAWAAVIPAEFRETAKIEIEAVSYYDSYTREITVSYFRPETDEDAAERLRRDAVAVAEKEQHDRRIYEKLKQRFGE